VLNDTAFSECCVVGEVTIDSASDDEVYETVMEIARHGTNGNCFENLRPAGACCLTAGMLWRFG
jgi:hypothetical protein